MNSNTFTHFILAGRREVLLKEHSCLNSVLKVLVALLGTMISWYTIS